MGLGNKMTHKCQCCCDIFNAEAMCDHFDSPNSHLFCLNCCQHFYHVKKEGKEESVIFLKCRKFEYRITPF